MENYFRGGPALTFVGKEMGALNEWPIQLHALASWALLLESMICFLFFVFFFVF